MNRFGASRRSSVLPSATRRYGRLQVCATWPRHLQAFTLIELILVMAVLMIVLAVSAPALSNFFRGRALDSEARRFVSLSRYAQSRAVSEGAPMALWLNLRNGQYGLRQETGYGEDMKAVQFTLAKDLHFEVRDFLPRSTPTVRRSSQQTDPGVPTLLFLPDGFFDESNPQAVGIREGSAKTGDSIWITQSRNRLNYEIHTNALQIGLR